MSRRVLIAGCGFLGSEIARQLIDRGDRIWGLRRDPAGLPPGIQPIAADLSDASSALELPVEYDLVIYSVGPDNRSAAAYRAAYETGFTRLAAVLRRQVRRPTILFTSSTGVYGADDGRWVDESSDPQPRQETSQLLIQAEQAALAADLGVTICRLAGLYGPGRRRLIDRVRRGEATCQEGPPHYGNRIHRDDAAAALIYLAELDRREELYLVADDEPAEQCAVITWLAERLDAPPPRHVPLGAGSEEGTNKRCRNHRLKATGYRLRYPTFREGYTHVLSLLDTP